LSARGKRGLAKKPRKSKQQQAAAAKEKDGEGNEDERSATEDEEGDPEAEYKVIVCWLCCLCCCFCFVLFDGLAAGVCFCPSVHVGARCKRCCCPRMLYKQYETVALHSPKYWVAHDSALSGHTGGCSRPHSREGYCASACITPCMSAYL
jgi:hypothetical protein